MKRVKLTEMVEKAELFTRRNSPAILTGFAIVGLISTAVMAYKAGRKADVILKEKKRDMRDIRPGDTAAKRAVTKETVKELAPIVAPVIIMGAATGACVIGAQSVSNRRIAALSAAYTLSETTVKSLTSKTEELIGERKLQTIKDAVVKDKLDKTAIPSEDKIIVTGNGNVLCKDSYSGRFFYSNAEKIRQAACTLSMNVFSDMYVALNEFYDLLGLEHIPLGDDLGWNADDLTGSGIPVTITALVTDDGRPCLCVEYDVSVRADYRNLH